MDFMFGFPREGGGPMQYDGILVVVDKAQGALEAAIRAEMPHEGVKTAAVTPSSEEGLSLAYMTLAAFTNDSTSRECCWSTVPDLPTTFAHIGSKICMHGF
jgi:hypothetical protein